MSDPEPLSRSPWHAGEPPLVVVRGGGDLATGAARRLFLAGLRVLVTERAQPWCVRRRSAFAAAVLEGSVVVDGVLARHAVFPELPRWDWDGGVAVAVCADRPAPPGIQPDLLVDGRVLKRGHDTSTDDAPLVVGVGPGFQVGRDCHAAVESARGHDLGRVLYAGSTLAFDGIPGALGGERERRVVRSTISGTFRGLVQIGDLIDAGQTIGVTDGRPVDAHIAGVVRGLVADGTAVIAQQKVGDVDPRGEPALVHRPSDKANAVGGGVVEAALVLLGQRD
jgi:xanthine dehydrogenase accessory factor